MKPSPSLASSFLKHVIKREMIIPTRYKVEPSESLTLVPFLVDTTKFLTGSRSRDQNEWWLTVLRNTVCMTGADMAMVVDWSVVPPARQGKGKDKAQLAYLLVPFSFSLGPECIELCYPYVGWLCLPKLFWKHPHRPIQMCTSLIWLVSLFMFGARLKLILFLFLRQDLTN